ncbi:hypothetical protein [Pandoraea sp. PE-S2R-1]|uniref:hypothetical protein n=1 Tax=Pandoraea sp. PE-S2R-1 TaxID=1986994 RepID=UPI001482A9ED|nr:hypothetical protein [Pandoraea sp. PE-S2R-1]
MNRFPRGETTYFSVRFRRSRLLIRFLYSITPEANHMDRLIAANTVPVGSGDLAPATGTPGQATDGNPATNTPATRFPSYAFNAIQEELATTILAGGLTLDRTNNGQLAQAVKFIAQKQVSGVVGQARNAKMTVSAPSTTATFTADEVILESVLGGLRYCVANASDAFNLGTDMDAGSAPVSGAVALYKLANPTTGAVIRRIVNTTSGIAPEIYAGAAPPAGYTVSALVVVWGTDSLGRFVVGSMRDRRVSFPTKVIFSTSTSNGSYTSFSTAGNIPLNAKTLYGGLIIANNTANVTISLQVAADANGTGEQGNGSFLVQANNTLTIMMGLDIVTAGSLYVKTSSSAGVPTFQVTSTGYTF